MNRLAKLSTNWSIVPILGLALSLVWATAAVPVVGAQSTSDPAAALVAFEKVAFGSSQNIDAALALFSDTAVLTVLPAPAGTSGVWTGKTEIKQGLLFNKQLNVARTNTGTPTVEGNKATTNAQVTNNYFTMLGLGAVGHTTEVVIENGKIVSYTSRMLTSEQPRVAAAVKAYQASHPTPAQQPAGVPNTGSGQQETSQTSSVIPGTSIEPSFGLIGLLAVGLLSLGGLVILRRRTTNYPK